MGFSPQIAKVVDRLVLSLELMVDLGLIMLRKLILLEIYFLFFKALKES
jgi:hypothetical protein